MSKEAAYKARGHKYLGDFYGRGGRKDSKIHKAMKGVASFSILDEVAKEDRQRARHGLSNGPTKGYSQHHMAD